MGLLSTIFGGDAQIDAAHQNVKDLRQARNASIADLAPYAKAGTNGLAFLQDGLGMADSDAAIARFMASPEYRLNYQTALDAGNRGVTDAAQATGTYNSGRTLKALQDRAQETSRGFFGDYLKGLGGITDYGLKASGDTADLRKSYADDIANGVTARADAKTSQYQGFDNVLSGGLSMLGGFGGSTNPIQGAGSPKNPFAYLSGL